MTTEKNQEQHALVSSWFLGPKGENVDTLKEIFDRVLTEQAETRVKLAKNGEEKYLFITKEMKDLPIYMKSIKTLDSNVRTLSKHLASHSVPFWSPRYNAHMNMDTTMASIIGYMSAMIYNPNNVATEASPYTTRLEREVGRDLSRMLGYDINPESESAAWGHITCDGSVANLEAIWAIRNLKFYPFSLKLAIREGALKFLSTVQPAFRVKTCKGEEKEFVKLTRDELLNLTPDTILAIPTTLNKNYSISPGFLQEALKPYLAQTTGKDKLEQTFKLHPGKFMISATKHYSWPKGGAISGIGSENFVDIAVDKEARMNTHSLIQELDKCIENDIPIFGVVAIMGSTEHGACDPLAEILEIRKNYQEKHGVSFAIHCDAAWGGYFAALLRESGGRDGIPYVPTLPLNPYTETQLKGLKDADSITIDPHKSGYINYPAGGLCYRDGRMRYLVTWTSPIVFHEGDVEGSMGVYGVEGSKPGASAAATWLTHKTLGLHQEGYGRLLGEAIFSCTKLYCHWATMTPRPDDEPDNEKLRNDALIVVPLIRLPAEADEKTTGDEKKEKIEEQKDYIRKYIVNRDNKELVEDKEAWKLLCQLGGDLMINAFATNFSIDGVVNQDVGEANYLNQWIFSQLSVLSEKDVVEERPLFLTSSEFSEKAYGECLEDFKVRLGLTTADNKPAPGDLRFLVNVTMSPWPTSPNFLKEMVKDFRFTAEKGVRRCIKRNKRTPDHHGFVIQGLESKELYFVHIAMFHMANHRKQLIIKAKLPDDVYKRYVDDRKKDLSQFFTIGNPKKETLEEMVEGLKNPETAPNFRFQLDKGVPTGNAPPPPLVSDFALEEVEVIVDESMAFPDLDTDYPDKMPFYLYGSQGETHMDHILKKSPNAQITTDLVKVTDFNPPLTDEQLKKGLVVVLDDVFEKSLQPLNTKKDNKGFDVREAVEHHASVYKTYEEAKSGSNPVARGKISVGDMIYADWHEVNMDGAHEH
ncbi:pyridoxal phosphate-dependent transferase [Cladorrhinum sp. PSN259]|nr:pyridoxal phosphate-dependent transferase [Cladorrhinum sp. PSN259]